MDKMDKRAVLWDVYRFAMSSSLSWGKAFKIAGVSVGIFDCLVDSDVCESYYSRGLFRYKKRQDIY